MSEAPLFEVIICDNEELIQQCLTVRYKVFIEEQGYPPEEEVDDWDKESIHFLLRQLPSKKPVGTTRFYPPKSKLGRLAVLPECRGLGYGVTLCNELKKYVVHIGGHSYIAASSQEPKIGFYSKLGYKEEGDIYLDGGQPHKLMKLFL
ncbi:hypothetical protein PROFUN_11164 [Planoprotostelium fungivorum]|uniref:N-acetyltransferase domain-containing protein n=1 Tax=Planoprotostelium fungivorum TaxID=1890364 RepID=A0A2P6NAP0_9EUKA|nr:hypothetical protein PROFUN_11164 [Planoprotostelium fungivorum]